MPSHSKLIDYPERCCSKCKFMMTTTNFLTLEYERERCRRDMATSEKRWKVILDLHKILLDHDNCEKRRVVHHFINDVAPLFQNLEKMRCISPSNFICCIRRVKYKIPSDTMNTLIHAFDDSRESKLEWRSILYMLHVANNPTLGSKDHLKLAYRFYTGNIFEVTPQLSKSLVSFQDMHFILRPIIRPDRLSLVLDDFETAWSSIASTSNNCIKLNQTSNNIIVTPQCFEMMLDNMEKTAGVCNLANIFDTHYSFDSMKDFFEEKYYSNTLKKHTRVARLMHLMTLSLVYKTKRSTLYTWKKKASNRKRMRHHMTTITDAIYFQSVKIAFNKLIQFRLGNTMTIMIQKCYRGYQGRVNAMIKYIIKRSVIYIQKIFRGYFQRMIFHHYLRKREYSVTDIQRVVRGWLHRIVARNRLLTHLDQEWKKFENEREESIIIPRKTKSAVEIQRWIRTTKALHRFNDNVARRRRENIIKQKMEEELNDYAREEKIYKEQIKEYYKSMKELNLENHAKYAHHELQYTKVKDLRLKLADDARKKDRLDKKCIERGKIEHAKKDLINKYKVVEEERCNSNVEYTLRCLRSPENKVERQFGKAIHERITRRMSDVLDRADSRNVKMEYKVARKIAENEILELVKEEERQRVIAERENMLSELECEMVSALNKKEELESIEKEKIACRVIVNTVRRWKARRLLLDRCMETYEKKFDEVYHSFYYYNKVTNETSWKKPICLGNNRDLPILNEWKIIQNEHGQEYFYNPHTMEMSWTAPTL